MPPPSGISIGLGSIKSKKPLGPPKSKKQLSAFAPADDYDGDDDAHAEPGGGIFGSKSTQKKKGTKDVSVVNAQLATFNELSKKAEVAAAQVEDPSIYDYDGVWEDMKSVDRRKKKADELDAIERKPKYMESLLASAEVRKRDQLKAKDKALQKERELEGDEFKDKESFVTEAYKKQQEEVRRLEEEERLREENLKKKSQGMSSFHRNMLNKMESKHNQLVAAAESKGKAKETLRGIDDDDDEATADAEKAAAEKARQLREKGASIEINEEGLVVDKSQLLSGGLNVTSSKKRVNVRPIADARRPQQANQGRQKTQQDMRARQSKMVEEQLAQATKRALEEGEKVRAELERQSKSRKTSTDVMSAKERYLARKAAAAAAKKE